MTQHVSRRIALRAAQVAMVAAGIFFLLLLNIQWWIFCEKILPGLHPFINKNVDLFFQRGQICAFGPREGMKRVRGCKASFRLDLETLIWTRGASLFNG